MNFPSPLALSQREIATTLVNLKEFQLGWTNACTGALLRELARLPKLHDYRHQRCDGLIQTEDFKALTQFPVLNQLSLVSCGLTELLGRCPNLAAVTQDGGSLAILHFAHSFFAAEGQRGGDSEE